MRSDHRSADGDRSHVERIEGGVDVVGAPAAAPRLAAVDNLPPVNLDDKGRYSVHVGAKLGQRSDHGRLLPRRPGFTQPGNNTYIGVNRGSYTTAQSVPAPRV